MQTTPLPAAPSDLVEFARTLTAAFLDDPVMRWAFPDDAVRARRLPVMWRYVAGGIYLPRGACTMLPGHDAVAMWAAPGAATADEFWEEHGARYAEDMEGDLERLKALGKCIAEHRPRDRDHWYLLAIGTRPGARGRGLGSLLLAHTLATADELRQPAFLEATSPRSRALYERFGFEPIDTFAPEGCPPLCAMWREPLS